MKKRIPFILACILILTIVGLVTATRIRNQNRKINHIIVKNTEKTPYQFINEDKIKELLLKKTNQAELTLQNLKTDSLEFWLQKNPHIKKANVFHEPNGNLIVYYTQKKPIVRVKDKGINYYITDIYEKIPLSKTYSPDILLVEGSIEPKEYKPLIELVTYINDDNLLKNNITGIRKEGKNFFTLSVNTFSFDIAFGTLNDKEEKFEKLKAFYNQYLTKIGLDTYKRISIGYKNQVIGIK